MLHPIFKNGVLILCIGNNETKKRQINVSNAETNGYQKMRNIQEL